MWEKSGKNVRNNEKTENKSPHANNDNFIRQYKFEFHFQNFFRYLTSKLNANRTKTRELQNVNDTVL